MTHVLVTSCWMEHTGKHRGTGIQVTGCNTQEVTEAKEEWILAGVHICTRKSQVQIYWLQVGVHRESHCCWYACCCLEYTFYRASLSADILVSTASEGEFFSAGDGLRHLNQRPMTFFSIKAFLVDQILELPGGDLGIQDLIDFIFLGWVGRRSSHGRRMGKLVQD